MSKLLHRSPSIYNDRGNIRKKGDYSRLRDLQNQVIGLDNLKAVTGTVSKVFIINNKMKGVFLDNSTNKKQRVINLSGSVWLVESIAHQFIKE